MIELRPATPQDGQQLLAWRNDPATRRASISREEVTATEHAIWLTEVSADPARELMIGEIDGVPVGTVRLDAEVGSIEISITVAPERRGEGLGGELLDAAIACISRTRPDAQLIARIREDNPPSLHLFADRGFRRVGAIDGVGEHRRAAPG